jgi:hypothetical protein
VTHRAAEDNPRGALGREAPATDIASVPPDPVADEALISELQRGERLLWSGRPDTSRCFVPDEPPRLVLTLGAGAYALVLSAIILRSTLNSGWSWFDLLPATAGLVFAVLGLYLVAGRVIARRYIGARTAYGLTNLRALVVKPSLRGGRHATFVWFASAPAITLRRGRDGHGIVMIGATIYQRAAWFAGDPGWIQVKPYERPLAAFWNIADAAEVSRLAGRLIGQAAA